jgi:molybdenum cofactor cytidylyltransferase
MEKKHVAAVVRKQEIPFLQSLCARDDGFLIDLDDPFGNLGCVIMASGLGKRFGSNKLMADFNGAPMIEQALLATDRIFSERIVVTRSEEVAAYCEKRGVCVILHALPNRNDTVRLGLLAMPKTEGCLFCPGDQPLLSRETVASLALAAKNRQNGIFRPACGETEGAPVLFPKSLYGELLNLPEGKGGGVVIKKHPELLCKVTVANPYELMDADTPEQLAFLLSRLR